MFEVLECKLGHCLCTRNSRTGLLEGGGVVMLIVLLVELNQAHIFDDGVLSLHTCMHVL